MPVNTSSPMSIDRCPTMADPRPIRQRSPMRTTGSVTICCPGTIPADSAYCIVDSGVVTADVNCAVSLHCLGDGLLNFSTSDVYLVGSIVPKFCSKCFALLFVQVKYGNLRSHSGNTPCGSLSQSGSATSNYSNLVFNIHLIPLLISRPI